MDATLLWRRRVHCCLDEKLHDPPSCVPKTSSQSISTWQSISQSKQITLLVSMAVTWVACSGPLECFDAVGAMKNSIPKDVYIDMYWCMHFLDNWELENEEWDEIFEHRRKFEFIKNGFNRINKE
jgi:hypothetical protein